MFRNIGAHLYIQLYLDNLYIYNYIGTNCKNATVLGHPVYIQVRDYFDSLDGNVARELSLSHGSGKIFIKQKKSVCRLENFQTALQIENL